MRGQSNDHMGWIGVKRLFTQPDLVPHSFHTKKDKQPYNCLIWCSHEQNNMHMPDISDVCLESEGEA